MKLAVVYDSKTGNTKQGAEWIVEGMNSVDTVEAKAFNIKECDEEFIKEAKGLIIGSPSYAATMTPDIHGWMLSNSKKLAFAGKLGGAFATQQFTHGGGSAVIQEILTIEMVNGMLCYSGGNSEGMPVIHLGPIGVNNNKEAFNGMDNYKDYFTIFGSRFAKKAVEINN
jgi:NAD(P)H dehydrogenase (quinone)